MSICKIGNFKLFLEENTEKFANIKYRYYQEKSEQIVKKIFFGEEISEQEKEFVEKHTLTTAKVWQELAEKFNELDIEITEEFLDINNMPYAP